MSTNDSATICTLPLKRKKPKPTRFSLYRLWKKSVVSTLYIQTTANANKGTIIIKPLVPPELGSNCSARTY